MLTEPTQPKSQAMTMLETYLDKIFKGMAKKTNMKENDVFIGAKVLYDETFFCAYKNENGEKKAFDKCFNPLKYMGTKIDLSGMIELSKMFLGAKIPQYAKELECDSSDVEILIIKNGQYKGELLKNNIFVKNIDLQTELL